MTQRQLMIDRLKKLIRDIEDEVDDVNAIVVRTSQEDGGILFAALGDEAIIDVLVMNVLRIATQRKVIDRRDH